MGREETVEGLGLSVASVLQVEIIIIIANHNNWHILVLHRGNPELRWRVKLHGERLN